MQEFGAKIWQFDKISLPLQPFLKYNRNNYDEKTIDDDSPDCYDGNSGQ